MSILRKFRMWFKGPSSKHERAEKQAQTEQLLAELSQENAKMTEHVQKVRQPDVLRSLMISMNNSGGRKHQ